MTQQNIEKELARFAEQLAETIRARIEKTLGVPVSQKFLPELIGTYLLKASQLHCGNAMTDFNSLPLAEQLKALQAGDELHLRGGGWLPFVGYNNYSRIKLSKGVAVTWTANGGMFDHNDTDDLDIIRVHRPTERKVPEVQSCDMADADWLRYMADKFVRDEPICERLLFIADKYEQMVFANIPKFLHPKTQRNVPEHIIKLRQKILDFENAQPMDFDESLSYLAFLFRVYIEHQHGILDLNARETP